MKLSDHVINIARAYDELYHELSLVEKPAIAFTYRHRTQPHIKPRQREHPCPPKFVRQHEPLTASIPLENKEKLIQLAVFQATFQDAPTPMTPDMYPIIIDTGASISLSPYASDFTTDLKPVQNMTIKGIASGLPVRGIGTLRYTITTDDGVSRMLLLQDCLYIPQCSIRLLCPRQIGLNTGHSTDGFNALSSEPILTIHGHPKTLKYDKISHLPLLFTTPGISTFMNYSCHLTHLKHDSSTPVNLLNLTTKQCQKLYLHEACAHEGFTNLNTWIKKGLFKNVPRELANEPDPPCKICNFGKARQLTHKSHVGHISAQHTKPGASISTDQMEPGPPGYPFTTKGSPSKLRYKYVNFWVDHHSSYVYVTFHQTKEVSELIKSKEEFTTWAASYNVNIETIRADNGVYAARAFQDHCMKHQQHLTFCAVGAHWQNGIAERFVGTITERARTILLHAMSKWPDLITKDFWPFAIRHAVNYHNATTHQGKTHSPHRLCTGEDPTWQLRDFRVFGSPAFVLSKALQDRSKINKWSARSLKGIYVGHSSCHAGSIPLIYNPATTHISPQFHVLHDEFFKTASGDIDQHEQYLDRLCTTTANWMFKDAYSSNPYTFDVDPDTPPMDSKPYAHLSK